ncbi:MAG: F0F1 ATP synthase subunit delta [Puniceicoccaceae bacterium]
MHVSQTKLKSFIRRLVELSKTDGRVDSKKVAEVLETLKAQSPRGLRQILSLYRNAVQQEIRRCTASVAYAGILSEATQQSLLQALETKFDRKLQLDLHEDPSLLAGIKITVGDNVMEHSIRRMLSQLHSAA